MARATTADAVRRPGKAERTRLQLVQAVREVIEADGHVTAETVAARANSSPATYYNHFSSNDGAVVAAFDAAMADLVDFVARELDVTRVLELGIDAFLESWTWTSLDFFRANSIVFDVASARARRSPEIRDIYRRREAEALEFYVRFVHLGQRAGMIRSGDTPAIAEVLMLTSQGWNHPRVLRSARGSALHRALVDAVRAQLTTEAGTAPRSEPSVAAPHQPDSLQEPVT